MLDLDLPRSPPWSRGAILHVAEAEVCMVDLDLVLPHSPPCSRCSICCLAQVKIHLHRLAQVQIHQHWCTTLIAIDLH